MQALHVLSAFKNPSIVLLRVIEVPSRTATLETDAYQEDIKRAEKELDDVSSWLSSQGLNVHVKVAVARNIADGIVEETERDGYLIVFMMKRRAERGWRRLLTRSVSQRVVRHANCLVLTAPLEQLSVRAKPSGKH